MADIDEDEWEEEEPCSEDSCAPSSCLFCKQTHKSVEELLDHCQRDHGVDWRVQQREKSKRTRG